MNLKIILFVLISFLYKTDVDFAQAKGNIKLNPAGCIEELKKRRIVDSLTWTSQNQKGKPLTL